MDYSIKVRRFNVFDDNATLQILSILKYVARNVVNEIVHDECEFTGQKLDESLLENLTIDNICGKCNYAAQQFATYTDQFMKSFGVNVKTHIVHGELTHSYKILPSEWAQQHTMNYVKINNKTYWVDCTAYQFSDIIDVPKITCCIGKPWWFYPDKNNPSFSKIGRWLNNHFGLKVRMGKYKVRLGIIEFFQYRIYGGICNIIRKIKVSRSQTDIAN